MSEPSKEGFAAQLVAWYDHAKRDLPWRRQRDPYAILVSELMLQQTQVKTVIPYFHRFLERFPTPQALAEAPQEQVLKAWEGLGYYRRARHLQAAAQQITEHHNGHFPQTKPEIDALKGVGAYTAAAVASIAFELPHACVDGNVIRVISRLFALDDDVGKTAVKKKLQALADELLHPHRPGDHNQAMMELGATVCLPKTPSCLTCPVSSFCTTQVRGDDPLLRPVKSKKPKPTRVDFQSMLLVHEGHMLLCLRPDEGLMAGMWELPSQISQQHKPWVDLLDGQVQQIGQLGEPVKHRFTHLDARYHVDLIRCDQRPSWRQEPSAYQESGWFTPAQLASIPHTKVLRKQLALLGSFIQEEQWDSAPSRLPGM